MAILGDNTQGAGGTNASADRIALTRVTATEDGTINGASAFFGAGTGGINAKFLMYNSDGSKATTLKYASAGVAVPGAGGQVDFALSGTFVAGEYYLGVVYDNNTAPDTQLSADSGLAGQDSELYADSYATPGDLTAATPIASYTDQRWNAWIDYTGGPPPPEVTPLRILSSGLRF